MVVAANPPPPGCPDGWPIKTTADSGVQIVWGPPHSRQLPGHGRFRGIGIKMRPVNAPGYPEHSESWAGLYGQKLHELFWRFRIRSPQDQSEFDMVTHLPMMGMPPREPTDEMMREVRAGRKFSSFFKFATVIKATDLHRDDENPIVVNRVSAGGDDVVIQLPHWPRAPNPEDSLYRRTQDRYGFEFRTHLPLYDTSHDTQNTAFPDQSLYFIQLLPNELPSYHFWAGPNDTPWLLTDNRKLFYGPGSPHYDDPGASYKQRMRLSPQNSRSNSSAGRSRSRPRAPSPGAVAGNKRPRSNNSSSSSSGAGPTIKKPRTKSSSRPRAKGNASARSKSSRGGGRG
jgi:hypothetical protein